MRIYGLDISLDHGGLVVLNGDGEVLDYAYITNVKKGSEIDPKHSILLSKRGKDESKETFRLRRMDEYLKSISDFLKFRDLPPESVVGQQYYSIEGYSYASQSTSICQIAELTGYLKHILFENYGKIRVHDPLSVKLFATNKGNASKRDVIEQALLAFDIPEGLIKKKTVKKKGKTTLPPAQWWEDYDGAATDIADAYFLARMLCLELAVRSGEVLLSNLKENERRIFLRVTKAFPVNLLDRDFNYRLAGE